MIARHHHIAAKGRRLHGAVSFLLVLCAACSDPEPQYATVRLTHDAPDATLTGVAGGPNAAADLVVGCVGFLGSAPDHVIVIAEPMKMDVIVRSARGPLSLAIVGPDGAVCDDDTGTGHAPHLGLIAAGRYEIWVGARLSADARLPYELSVLKNDKSRVRMGSPGGGTEVAVGGGAGDTTVSVTVTSQPSGAEVRTAGGQVLGTTPAMFAYPATAAERAAPIGFLVAMRGQAATRVEGRAQNGELVLHATLAVGAPIGPGMPGETIQSASPQRIRDFTTVSQGADYASDCTIASLSVTVDVRHTCPSDLRVSLRSPTGETAMLQNHASRRLGPRTFAMSDSRTALTRFVGQSARGRWELTVRDDVDADVGSFESFSVSFTCGGAGVRTTAAPSPTGTGTGSAVYASALTPAPVRIRSSRGTASEVLNPWDPGPPRYAPARAPAAYPAPPPPVLAAPARRPIELSDPWGH